MQIYRLSQSPRWCLLFTMGLVLIVFPVLLSAQSTIDEMLSEEGFAIAIDGSEAPDFSLERLGGGKTSLSSLQGKVVFVNFWATWCGPCRIEMPSMERLYNQMSKDHFEILAVDLREAEETVAQFAKDLNLSFPVLLDSQGTTGAIYVVQSIPTTFLVNKEGHLIGRLIGSREWDTDSFINLLETLIEE
jgi:thiol-disulfide isomerase/thioredoxin